jgi:hypothetical protein
MHWWCLRSIGESRRRTTVEVGRRRNRKEAHLTAKRYCDHVLRDRFAQAYAYIKPLIYDIDECSFGYHVQRSVGISPAKRRKNICEEYASSGRTRANAKRAARLIAKAVHVGQRLLYIVERQTELIRKARSRLCWPDTPGAPVNKRTPRSRSSERIAWLSVDGATPSSSSALRKLL